MLRKKKTKCALKQYNVIAQQYVVGDIVLKSSLEYKLETIH